MQPTGAVLGVSTDSQLNDGCVVFFLRYGSFDALFPGDADDHVEGQYIGDQLADGQIELLKVSHHGAKTGMTLSFVDRLKPAVSAISVGKKLLRPPLRRGH